MMRITPVGMLLIAVMCGSSAHAADVAAGKEKPRCVSACHGEGGISQIENIPSLAASPISSFSGSWCSFVPAPARTSRCSRSSSRSTMTTFAISVPISPSSLRPRPQNPTDNPDLSTKGAQAAAGRRCASCHTDSYAGTKAVARIAGQREEYLLKALHDYKSGVRSGGGMAAMADVAYPLSEEENRGTGALSRAFVTSS